MRTTLFLLLFALPTLANKPPTIVDRPLPLTVSSERQLDDDEQIDTVMLHFASDVVANPADPHSVERIAAIFEEYRVSAHYCIDRDGTIYRFVDESRAAWHAGRGEIEGQPRKTNRLNHYSIGIEMLAIGTQEEMSQWITPEIYATIDQDDIGFTDAQYASLTRLLADIAHRNDGIELTRTHIIGHDAYTVTRPTPRTDPGSLFDWSKIGL
ncbi:MAG: N-acetylmuramoyl-L-alanine amidase [Planctomycetota bacterium]